MRTFLTPCSVILLFQLEVAELYSNKCDFNTFPPNFMSFSFVGVNKDKAKLRMVYETAIYCVRFWKKAKCHIAKCAKTMLRRKNGLLGAISSYIIVLYECYCILALCFVQ